MTNSSLLQALFEIDIHVLVYDTNICAHDFLGWIVHDRFLHLHTSKVPASYLLGCFTVPRMFEVVVVMW